jgi:hypothetical protein
VTAQPLTDVHGVAEVAQVKAGTVFKTLSSGVLSVTADSKIHAAQCALLANFPFNPLAVQGLEALNRPFDVALDGPRGGRPDRPEQRPATQIDLDGELAS